MCDICGQLYCPPRCPNSGEEEPERCCRCGRPVGDRFDHWCFEGAVCRGCAGALPNRKRKY
ncbi:MAG: hypothetical protein IKI50_01515 [Clostridia bacterium]|nr:hypothetical protein [Clostridia bacterium]